MRRSTVAIAACSFVLFAGSSACQSDEAPGAPPDVAEDAGGLDAAPPPEHDDGGDRVEDDAAIPPRARCNAAGYCRSALPSFGPADTLRFIAGSSKTDVWTGGGARLWHFDGREWSLALLPATLKVTIGASAGPDHAWLFGWRQGRQVCLRVRWGSAGLELTDEVIELGSTNPNHYPFYRLAVVSDDELWVINDVGAQRLTRRPGSREFESTLDPPVADIQSRHGVLWALRREDDGSSTLARRDARGDTWTTLPLGMSGEKQLLGQEGSEALWLGEFRQELGQPLRRLVFRCTHDSSAGRLDCVEVIHDAGEMAVNLFVGLIGVARNDVWLLSSAFPRSMLLHHYDGATWTLERTAIEDEVHPPSTAVWASVEGDIWVMEDQFLLHKGD